MPRTNTSPEPDGQGRARILMLVDDNAAMRAFIRGLVAEVAPVIHEFGDGQSALDAYPGIRPDWVIMDIEMEGMDGIAATRAILRLDPDARVVIVTGHGDEPHRHASTAAGATAFVLKDDLLELPAMLAAAPLGHLPGD